jgi:hypothetical protein
MVGDVDVMTWTSMVVRQWHTEKARGMQSEVVGPKGDMGST